MKRVLGLVLLAACGGSGGNAAVSKTFSYGAPQAPTSTESTAATSAQSSLSAAANFNTTASVSNAGAVIDFASTVVDGALGSSGFGVEPRSANPRGMLRAAVSATDFSTCGTLSGNTVTFNNCTDSSTGFSFTLNGHVSAAAGAVSWDVTGNFSGAENGESFSVTIHEGGNFGVTTTAFTGNATVEVGGSASAQGQSISFGVDQAVVVGLNYQTSPSFCVTAGDIEAKRVWSNRPQGATGLNDAAAKITWSGCNTIQVAHGT